MRQILALTRKEILLWVKRPGSWIIVFIVPLLFIWIVQAVFGASGTPVVTVYAVNEDESQESRRVMEALRAADHLRIEELETRQEADRRVSAGERMAALVIPEGFSSALATSHGATIDIIIDPARSEQANIVIGLANAALAQQMVDAEVSRGVEAGVSKMLGSFDQNEQGNEVPVAETPTGNQNEAGAEEDTAQEYPPPDNPGEETGSETGETGAETTAPAETNTLRTFFTAAVKGVVSSQVQEALQNPQIQVSAQPSGVTQPTRRPSLLDYLIPGYSLMFVYFLIPSLALAVIEERQSGTLRRLLIAPVSRSKILLGKLLPYFLIAVAQLIVILTAGRVLFGIDLGNSTFALAVMVCCSALAMAGLGILIAAFARSEGQADGLATIIVLAMAVVSGAMFPGIAIPGLQMVTPHYWSMQGFLNVILHGQGVASVLGPAGILLTMAAVFFTLGAVRFQFE